MHPFDDSCQSPVGAVGKITVPVPAEGPGEVLVGLRGGSEVFAAWSTRPLAVNTRVVVTDTISARSVLVEPLPP
ncbi:hypothetical protein Kpho02_69120 [Kitasatospora phosalacinea]|uniref:NfeD-like C-terminal domain-containing protein n=1 Tax=Kitasatospora phosalacinea TaxID=2065 RepID=A0A9W6V3P8_9ACTN|nr:hypothetical protein [Kitasatospora phosalacinea]GLW74614.1 hypothetical protein Kpho02_69120 [Kitasatospora phosalacinea]